MRHESYLTLAASLSMESRLESTGTKRSHFLCAIGMSRGGVLRTAVNRTTSQITLSGHAERILLRKASGVKTVYIARTFATGEWALAKPCVHCEAALRVAGVQRAIYTVAQREYGIIHL